MMLLVGRCCQALGTGCLDLLDLLLDEAPAVNVAPQFGERVRRNGRASAVRKAASQVDA